MINNIRIVYKDLAVGAKQAFTYSLNDKVSYTPETVLGIEDYVTTPYAIIGELNQMFLDETQEFIPSDKSTMRVGTWSNSQTNVDKSFSSPIILTITSQSNFTSQGFTLTFDKHTNTYPVNVEIKWYRGTTLLDTKQYTCNSYQFFFDNLVQNYNKVEFKFLDMNMPYSRLKLDILDFGIIRTYMNDELGSSVKVRQEMSSISNEISINTLDFKLITKSSAKLLFQAKQPLEFYINDVFKGMFFVKEGTRTSEQKYEIKAEDYIGNMDSSYFYGGIYNNYSVLTLLNDIFSSCNIPYELIGTPQVSTLTGYIPYCTSRQALQQVLFACGMVCDTSDSDKVKIFNVNTTSSNTYGESDIIQGQKSKSDKVLTEVRLTEHFYKNTTSKQNVIYDGSKSGTCTNKLVIFDRPYHSLSITNGTIIESGANYAIITISSTSGVLQGYEYEETQTEYVITNPNTNVADLENIITIMNATLIGSNNAQIVAQKVFDYYSSRDIVTAKIVGLEETLGQTITMSNTYLDDKTGVIESISYNATGDYVPEVKVR